MCLTLCLSHTHTNRLSAPERRTLSCLHSPEHLCKKLQIISSLLSYPLPRSILFYTIFFFLYYCTSTPTSPPSPSTCVTSDTPSFPLLLSMLFSSPVLLGPCDLQCLNVVLCLQSADEIVICHINGPSPLPCIHTHTQTNNTFPV